MTLDDVVARLKVRRVDVRSAITALHTQGLVDATTMRLTMQGFVIGAALTGRKLPPIARPAAAAAEPSGEHHLDLGPNGPPSTRPRLELKRTAAA